MSNAIETQYFDNLPSIRRIMGTRMSMEHKRIAASCIQNFREQRERGELGEEDLDQLINELKLWIYSFAVSVGYTNREAKTIAGIPLAFKIGTHLGEMLVAHGHLPEV